MADIRTVTLQLLFLRRLRPLPQQMPPDMSVSHCMNRALEIARLPEADWPARIETLPDACAHSECGAPRSCRARAQDFLRMQWRIRRAKAAKAVPRD